MKVHISMSSLCLEIWRCKKNITVSIFVHINSLATLPPKINIPIDPNLNLGCSAGSVIPRRSGGAAAAAVGRWMRSVGRAEQRRAREAARGRKKDIVIVYINQVG